jgi:hypothetical protein
MGKLNNHEAFIKYSEDRLPCTDRPGFQECSRDLTWNGCE